MGKHYIGPVGRPTGSIDPVGRHFIGPVGNEAGVLTLTDPRDGQFFENCPKGIRRPADRADVVFSDSSVSHVAYKLP